VFLYTLARIAELFLAFPVILATACYFLYIFWVPIDMYIIHLFPDDPVDPALDDHEYERINIPGDEKETERNDKPLSFPTPILASEIIHVQWKKVI
jgi:hypothetical protein